MKSNLVTVGFAMVLVGAALCRADVLIVGTGPDAKYKTIQGAVDAAAEGATVRIEPGTYEGPVVIRKPIILDGAGWDKTTIVTVQPPVEELETAIKEFEQQVPTLKGRAAIQELQAALAERIRNPAIRIDGTRGVELRNFKVTSRPAFRPKDRNGGGEMLVSVVGGKVKISGCAFVGSPGGALFITDGATAEISKSLVAAVGHVGIRIGDRLGEKSTVRIIECDVRNCYVNGISIVSGNHAIIERSRISGSAWHGIRYDDASPIIVDNRIFGVARCGIYASGKTQARITGNVFADNEMSGVACWFENADEISGNTFTGNLRESLAVLGASKPTVAQNIFVDTPVAILCSTINDSRPTAKGPGEPSLSGNLFWKAAVEIRKPDPTNTARPDEFGGRWIEAAADAASQSLRIDPATALPGIGAGNPVSADSPFPIQPEEIAIIPDGRTRDYSKWKFEPSARPR